MEPLRLGTSSYSYWHFLPEKVPLETVLDAAAKLGLSGVEILHRQMESEENAYLQKLKRQAFRLGLDLYNLSIHQDFVWAEPEERQKNIEHTLHCIDLAHELGIPSIREFGRVAQARQFRRGAASEGMGGAVGGLFGRRRLRLVH